MNIVCRMDKTDTFSSTEQVTYIDFFDSNSFLYTFWNNRNKLPYWYSQQALDYYIYRLWSSRQIDSV